MSNRKTGLVRLDEQKSECIRSLPDEYDVVVLGGGTAGVVSAIQSGRLGVRTLLVEKNGMLGGTMTVGGINHPSHFHAWGRQVVGGIGYELARRTLMETGSPAWPEAMARDDDAPQYASPVRVDRGIYAALCDEAVLEAGVELLLHAMPAVIMFERERWTVSICTKTGLREIRSKAIIDATGDADGVFLAGFERVHSEVVQPATLQMQCSGYDAAGLDYAALREAARKAILAGEIMVTDICWQGQSPETFLRGQGCNANHIRALHAETSEGRTAVEVEARRSVLRMHRFFRKQPGLENFRVDWFCSEAGIRETVTIRGKATVTDRDYEQGTTFPDALCYAFYPIDEHLNDGMGVNYRELARGVLPTVPRGALLPAGSRFLLAAGRCVSSEREANSGLRVECSCMAMGQAAGVLAALSAKTGVDPEFLPMEDVRAVLHEQGAIVP